ncbi:MAG: ISNCY family transposase [Chloroflexota bacterium]|nr:ISNCY family transposase [Chloroflexota bacterium]
MITDRYDPVNIFELLPEKLKLEMDPVMARLDSLLDDEVLLTRIKEDLARRHPNSKTLGRRSTPVEVIFRMLIVRRLYDLSYEQTERLVSDSLVLRQFCRVYLERVPDDTTLIRWTNLVGEETVRRVHEHVVALAREHKVTRGRKLRIDGTVVETNIAHPTDSGLLRDGVRVLGRLARKAKRCLADEARAVGNELFRDRTRSAKRLARKIDEAGRRRTKEAKEASLAAYRRLVEVAKASLGQAKKQREALLAVGSAAVEALREESDEVSESVERVIGQTRRRVFEGEQVPAQEKLVSIFEAHTRIIRRGKSGTKATEFGRKVWLSEVEGGIISDYRILEGNPKDESQVVPSLEAHQLLFGRAPGLLAGDRATHSEANEAAARERGVKRVALPKPGAKGEERKHYEREGWFRRARRFRAGIEGRISVCKRRGALGRCRDKGEAGYERWVGLGIVSANLFAIARKLAAD